MKKRYRLKKQYKSALIIMLIYIIIALLVYCLASTTPTKDKPHGSIKITIKK